VYLECRLATPRPNNGEAVRVRFRVRVRWWSEKGKLCVCVCWGFPCPITTCIRMLACFSNKQLFLSSILSTVQRPSCTHTALPSFKSDAWLRRGGERWNTGWGVFEVCRADVPCLPHSHHLILSYLFSYLVFSWNEWLSVSEGMKHVLSRIFTHPPAFDREVVAVVFDWTRDFFMCPVWLFQWHQPSSLQGTVSTCCHSANHSSYVPVSVHLHACVLRSPLQNIQPLCRTTSAKTGITGFSVTCHRCMIHICVLW
jgi:hypothetical protein